MDDQTCNTNKVLCNGLYDQNCNNMQTILRNRMDGQNCNTDRQMDRWTDGQVDRWLNRWRHADMVQQMIACRDEQMKARRHGTTEGCRKNRWKNLGDMMCPTDLFTYFEALDRHILMEKCRRRKQIVFKNYAPSSWPTETLEPIWNLNMEPIFQLQNQRAL